MLLQGFRHYLPVGRRRRDPEAGFSLVETLAALVVFGIITLGLVPLLAASIRGSDVSRKGTVGKQMVVKAMERARGVPFYVAYNSQARKVDLLDLYFPNRTPTFGGSTCTGYLATGTAACTATSYAATGPSYVTTCPDATNIACPKNLPSNYTLTYDASFVTVSAGSPETYTRYPPLDTYAYNSVGYDSPQTLLMQLTITARWANSGRGPRTYQVRSLISDRKFSGLKVLGDAEVSYGVQVIAGYGKESITNDTEVVVTAGNAVSHIETRRVAAASQSVQAGRIDFYDVVLAENSIEGDEDLDGTPRYGLNVSAVAPPDSDTNPVPVPAPSTVDHPQGTYGTVAALDLTDSDQLKATTDNSLPVARGEFEFSESALDDFYLRNSRLDIGGNDYRLDPDDWTARLVSATGIETEGESSATTNALGSQPGVTSAADVSFKELHLLKTDFIDDVDDLFDGALLAITGPASGGAPSGVFEASANCNANNNGTTHATAASGTYSGTLWYWRDPSNNNDRSDGGYVGVSLSPSSTTLASLQSGSPILVYDAASAAKDVYLFPTGSSLSYLKNWASSPASTSVTNSGRVTSASIPAAVSIETVPLEGSAEPATSISASVGSVSCRAEDYR